MQISFYIFGNKESNNGFSALLINGTSRNIPYTDIPGFEANAEYYTIQNTESDTLFTITNKHVSSRNGTRNGLLRIAIAIPNGFRLAGGVSPHTLLRELYDLYMSRYMTRGFSGAQFTTEDETLDTFTPILSRYPLERCLRPVRPCTGTERACVIADEATAAALFLDTAYPEFQPYAEIVVAASNASTLPVLSVPAPRQPVYTVYLNGKMRGTVNPAIMPEFALSEKAENEHYRPINQSINIAQARAGALPGIVVDDSNETITCKISAQPICVKCRLSVTGVKVSPSQCFLKAENRHKEIAADGSFELRGEEISITWTIGCSDPSIKIVNPSSKKNPNGTALFTGQAVKVAASHGSSKRKGGSSSPLQVGLLSALIALLLGIGIGYMLWGTDDKNTKTERTNPNAENSDSEEKPNESNPDKEKYESYLKALLGTDFLFADLNEMEEFVKSDAGQKIDSTYKDRPQNQLSKRIEAYKRLKKDIDFVTSKGLVENLGNIKKLVESSDMNYTKEQKELVLILCEIKNKNKLKGFNNKINKFSDIRTINDQLERGTTPPGSNLPKEEKKTTPPKPSPTKPEIKNKDKYGTSNDF